MVVYLNIYIFFDLLDFSLRIDVLIDKVKKEGYCVFVIIDINVLYGYLKFYDVCIVVYIYLIFGMIIYLMDGFYIIEMVVLVKNN